MSRVARRPTAPYLDSVRRRRRAELLLEYVPETAGGYVEPLLDGGAVAVALLVRHPEWSFVLGSPNPELVTVWTTVQKQAEELVERVAFHTARHSAPYFAAERARATETTALAEPTGAAAPDVERAARFIYLRGTAAPGPRGVPRQVFDEAELGRDVPAFDAAGVLELAAVLGDRDVEFVVGSPYSFLPAVREDDVVLLELPGRAPMSASVSVSAGVAADTQKELRGFAGAVTAKGAALLLDATSAEQPDGLGAWRDIKRIEGAATTPGGVGASGGAPPEDAVWGNRVLQRLRAAAAPSGH